MDEEKEVEEKTTVKELSDKDIDIEKELQKELTKPLITEGNNELKRSIAWSWVISIGIIIIIILGIGLIVAGQANNDTPERTIICDLGLGKYLCWVWHAEVNEEIINNQEITE